MVKVEVGHLFACSWHNPMYGGKKPLQNHPHCTLRHGLRHLHGVPAGEEPVRGMLLGELCVQEALHDICLSAGEVQV